MEDLNKKLIFLGLALCVAGCGVKGRPNPPKNPPSLGRGEPMYKETKKKKTTPSTGTSLSNEEDVEQ